MTFEIHYHHSKYIAPDSLPVHQNLKLIGIRKIIKKLASCVDNTNSDSWNVGTSTAILRGASDRPTIHQVA